MRTMSLASIISVRCVRGSRPIARRINAVAENRSKTPKCVPWRVTTSQNAPQCLRVSKELMLFTVRVL